MNGELEELINLLDETCRYLVEMKKSDFAEGGKNVINKCLALFPKIIVSYSDPRMADISEDATYWPAQLERIINVLEGGDSFAAIDVLYNETRENLKFISNEYAKRGIAL